MTDGKGNAWRATLTPHRSLSPRGFLFLMAVITGINLVAGLMFFWLGAWPIAGFCGLDVLLLYWAFRRNFADARISEHIEVNEQEVILHRVEKGALVDQRRFNRRWVRVELEEDLTRELIGSLYLLSHGKRTEIARFLAPNERKELAGALKAAIASPRI